MRLLAAFLPILFFSTGCRAPEKPTVGVVPGGSGQSWQCVHAGAVKAAREFDLNIEWSARANQLDAASQVAIVDSMVKRHLAGIVLAPVDPKLLAPAVERATKAGVPVAIIESDVATPRRLTYISADERGAGRTAADRLGELMRGEGKAAILAPSRRDEATLERESSFKEELQAKYPKIQLVRTAYVDENKGHAIAQTHEILQAYPDLAGLFSASLNCSEGAVYELRSRGTSRVRIVAYQSSPDLVDELRNRFIDVLIVPDPIRLGYEGVNAIAIRLHGGSPPEKIACDTYVVDRTNVESPESVTYLYPDLKSYLGPEAN